MADVIYVLIVISGLDAPIDVEFVYFNELERCQAVETWINDRPGHQLQAKCFPE